MAPIKSETNGENITEIAKRDTAVDMKDNVKDAKLIIRRIVLGTYIFLHHRQLQCPGNRN